MFNVDLGDKRGLKLYRYKYLNRKCNFVYEVNRGYVFLKRIKYLYEFVVFFYFVLFINNDSLYKILVIMVFKK